MLSDDSNYFDDQFLNTYVGTVSKTRKAAMPTIA